MSQFNSEEYIHYRIQRAKETLLEVELLINNNFLNAAMNRMYYASFYAVTALLLRHGIETLSHSGTRQKFGQLFVKNGLIEKELGKHFTNLYEKRQKGDYDDFFEQDEETITSYFPKTKLLISAIEELIQKKQN